MKDQWKEQMERDEVQSVIDAIKKRAEQKGELCAETLEKVGEKVGYLEKSKDKMLYATFRQQGLFYGSGVLEAGCRVVIGKQVIQHCLG